MTIHLASLLQPYETELEQVQDKIRTAIASLDDEVSRRHMTYFLSARGHMLRPTLVLLTFGFIDGRPYKDMPDSLKSQVYTLAAALELLHTASLVHDDVIDTSEDRRGQSTLNKKLGNNEAILIGNLFYLSAFRLAVSLGDDYYLKELISTAEAMCIGEVAQNEAITRPITKSEYLGIVQKKTGKLISCASQTAAHMAGASGVVETGMANLAMLMGVMYQLKDDSKDGDIGNVDAQIALNLRAEKHEELMGMAELFTASNSHGQTLKELIHYFKE